MHVYVREGEREGAKRAQYTVYTSYTYSTHRYIHDAAGKVFVDNKDTGVIGRIWTISSIEEHAATMLVPKNEDFNFDFSFNNCIHVFYKKSNFINLKADKVKGVRSWRFTEGGSDAPALARVGAGGGTGYSFRSHPHICFCEATPCPHAAFTGAPSEHKVLPCTQEKADREQAA
tara:strand:- start:347 stop:868 length:522 start_codon:yes stop_codon:yes gene_type:complete